MPSAPAPGSVAHFAIDADDVEAAQRSYGATVQDPSGIATGAMRYDTSVS